MWKVIKVDNFNRDTVDDVLICENVSQLYGDYIVSDLNNRFSGEHSDVYFRLVPNDYKLHKYDWEGNYGS